MLDYSLVVKLYPHKVLLTHYVFVAGHQTLQKLSQEDCQLSLHEMGEVGKPLTAPGLRYVGEHIREKNEKLGLIVGGRV